MSAAIATRCSQVPAWARQGKALGNVLLGITLRFAEFRTEAASVGVVRIVQLDAQTIRSLSSSCGPR